ncbi:MAG: protein kinase [Labilithrix sp.]|nr:protein kinase [Labilithrix sp.]MCW5816167.1 protein kinase [Labilithrix sp.]
MEAAESSLFPGYRLDRYELLCPIASGGMASVWLARLRGKRGFEKLFAIKTIKTELISDPNYQQMFLDEARIASRIVHPNVAQILELGEENDILFLVMEWVDGDSLAKVHRLSLKQNTPFPAPMCLRIVADICSGLHAAHQLKDAATGELLGVVHRDVSPQNVLLSNEGNAKVIDFGLVKAKNRTSAETESGIVKGKIRYMAPEQVGGRSSSIDHRADVWAAGMCLLELVTGKQPYPDLDDLDVVKKLMTPAAAPDLPDDLPDAVRGVLQRALVHTREERFASCAQMKRAIDQAIIELGEAIDPDDISSFVKENLPDLSSKRARTIARAIEQADSRAPGETGSNAKYSVPTSPSSTPALESGEIAFAATEVSQRNPQPVYDDAVPLTRKVRTGSSPAIEPIEQIESDSDRSISNLGASRSTPGSLLRDQLGESKGRRSSVGFWIAAAVVAAAGGWVLWPRNHPPPTTGDTTPASAAVSTTPPPSAVPVDTTDLPPASGPATSASASPVDVDLELPPNASAPDAGPKKHVTAPASGPAAPVAKAAEVDAGEKKKFNPAWSILTNPPPGVLSSDPDAPPPPPKAE